MKEEGVEGVLADGYMTGDGLGEGAKIVSFMAEMRPKMVNRHFIWFAHLKCVPMNFSGLALLEWSGLIIVTGRIT